MPACGQISLALAALIRSGDYVAAYDKGNKSFNLLCPGGRRNGGGRGELMLIPYASVIMVP
jgi:hypothetical protein